MQIIANRFEIVKKLGEGGFGAVYLVRHKELGLLYALKLIKSEKAKEENFLNRFKREAMVLSKLLHPRSIPLREFGQTEDGFFYMAMDYCPGKSLQKVLDEEGGLSPFRTANILIQILDVMVEAHRLGIVHRDMKPDNVMVEIVEGEELVKVLDFGIARLEQDFAQGKKAHTLTQEGAIVGTPMYMPPEQVEGGAVDARSDLYALGMMMYQMLSGRNPFEGESHIQILMMQMQKMPIPLSQIPDLPYPVSPEMEEILWKAIQKDPAKRFQSAAKFKEACTQILEELKREEQGTLEQRSFSSKEKTSGKSISSTRLQARKSMLGTGKNPAVSTKSGRHLAPKAAPRKNNPIWMVASIAGFVCLLIFFFVFLQKPSHPQNKGKKTPLSENPKEEKTPPQEHKKANLEDSLKEARKYLRNKSYEDACKSAREALLAEPKNKEALSLLSEAQEKKGDLPGALESFEKIAQAEGDPIIKGKILLLQKIIPLLDKRFEKSVITVSSKEDVHFSSLEEAIEKAPEYSRILLFPGFYKGGLTIKKPVEIIGYGRREEIVIRSEASFGLDLKATPVILRGLSLKGDTASFNKERAMGLRINFSTLVSDCHISGYWGGMGISGEKAENTRIEGCDIFSNNLYGILFFMTQGIVLEKSQFHSNMRRGLEFRGGTRILVKRCEVFNNIETGVVLLGRSTAGFENSKVHSNGLDQFFLEYDGVMTLTDCEISSGKRYGILCKGKCILQKCRIHSLRSGVAIYGTTELHVQQSHFTNHTNGDLTQGEAKALEKGAAVYWNGVKKTFR